MILLEYRTRWPMRQWNLEQYYLLNFDWNFFCFFSFDTLKLLLNNWTLNIVVCRFTQHERSFKHCAPIISYRLLPNSKHTEIAWNSVPFSTLNIIPFLSLLIDGQFGFSGIQKNNPNCYFMLYTHNLKWKWRAQSWERKKKRIFDWHIFDTLIITVS